MNKKLNKTFSSVAIRYFPIQLDFILEFATLLKKKYQSKIYYYTDYPDSLKKLKKFIPKYFDEVLVMFPNGRRIQMNLNEQKIFRETSLLEKKYKRSLNYFVMLDRINGRSFSPAGYYSPRSSISEGDYLSVLNKNINWIKFWENEFKKRNISIMINPLHIEANVSRFFNVKSFLIMSAKYENFYFWSDDEYGCSKKIERDFLSRKKKANSDVGSLSEPFYQGAVKAIYSKKKFLSHFLFRTLRRIYQNIYWLYKSYERKYDLISEISLYYREYRDFNFLEKTFNKGFKDIKDKKYVFYALQDEPETNFQGRSPEYFYQMSCILSLSRDLPADTYLVVKEHIASIGKRPKEFYNQISELKNVIFINFKEKGIDIVSRARIVVTICGTVGFEAALMGVPVISFGRHNFYNLLKNVTVIKNEDELRPAIDNLLNRPLKKDLAKKEAENLLSVILHNSFNMNKFSYLDSKGFDKESIKTSLKMLENLI